MTEFDLDSPVGRKMFMADFTKGDRVSVQARTSAFVGHVFDQDDQWVRVVSLDGSLGGWYPESVTLLEAVADPTGPCPSCGGKGRRVCTSPDCEHHRYFSSDPTFTCPLCEGRGTLEPGQ